MPLYRSYYQQAIAAPSTPPPPVASYADLVLGLSPVGQWPCDDASGNLADYSGHGWNATISGTPSYLQTGPTIDSEAQLCITVAPSVIGTVNASIDANVSTATGMTVACWFKSNSATDAGLVAMYGASGARSWALYYSSIGTLSFYTYQTDGATEHATCASAVSTYDDGNWHLVVGWVEAGAATTHLRIDDTAQTDDATPAGTWNAETSNTLTIAALASGNSHLTGSICHVAYWDSDIGSTARTSLYTGT